MHSRLPTQASSLALSLGLHVALIAAVVFLIGRSDEPAARVSGSNPLFIEFKSLRPVGEPAAPGTAPTANASPAPTAPRAARVATRPSRGAALRSADHTGAVTNPTRVAPFAAVGRAASSRSATTGEANPARAAAAIPATQPPEQTAVAKPADANGEAAAAQTALAARSSRRLHLASAWLRPGEVDRAASPRWPIRPEYPTRARQLGLESTVIVEAFIDDGGQVAFSTVVESGGEDFDVSAQRAVERSAFRPAQLAGQRVASRVALRIHFELYD